MGVRRKKSARVSAIHKLDRVFSVFVRRSRANLDGLVECVTCNKWMHWKDIHAGHYVSRRHMATRFDERNVHPQCAGCNTFQYGKLDTYSLYIRDEYGETIWRELLALKNTQRKWNADELQQRIEHYQSLVDLLPN